MERSLELMVGLLGILKAGAAYVPLDPSFPKERLAFIVEDAGIEVAGYPGAPRPRACGSRRRVDLHGHGLAGDLTRSRMEISMLRSRPTIWRT